MQRTFSSEHTIAVRNIPSASDTRVNPTFLMGSLSRLVVQDPALVAIAAIYIDYLRAPRRLKYQ